MRIYSCSLKTWCILSVIGISIIASPSPAPCYSLIPTRFLFSIEHDFLQPSDVAVDAGHRIYVVDGVNHVIKVFDSSGNFLKMFGGFGEESGKLRSPLGIAIGKDGSIYVADTGNHRIQIFSDAGSHRATIDLPAEKNMKPPDPVDVAIDETAQRLYVVDNDNHRILIYRLPEARLQAVWGSEGTLRDQFNYPFFIALGKDRSVFIVDVINTRVQVWSPNGEPVATIGGWGIDVGRLYRPKGVCVDRDNYVYVSDSYLGVVQVFNRFGHFKAVLGTESGDVLKTTTPVGITIDDRQRLYVVEMMRNRIGVYQILDAVVDKEP